uniref:Uncharacterized protein n=1 Tax=viral metagenome TaxID=1070528 RepID=A0A6M3JQD4_9ZZZZ
MRGLPGFGWEDEMKSLIIVGFIGGYFGLSLAAFGNIYFNTWEFWAIFGPVTLGYLFLPWEK